MSRLSHRLLSFQLSSAHRTSLSNRVFESLRRNANPIFVICHVGVPLHILTSLSNFHSPDLLITSSTCRWYKWRKVWQPRLVSLPQITDKVISSHSCLLKPGWHHGSREGFHQIPNGSKDCREWYSHCNSLSQASLPCVRKCILLCCGLWHTVEFDRWKWSIRYENCSTCFRS